jgi:uncharacterized protein
MLIMWGTAAVGLIIGLVIGSFGGGGGILTLPVLVYLVGQTAQDATTSSVIIVGCTAVVGALARVRDRTIAWRTALAFGAVGIPSAAVGTVLNQRVDQQVVLLAFAGVALVAAAAMLLGDAERGSPDSDAPGAAAAPCDTAVRTRRRTVRTAVQVVVAGVVVGLLTGFLGVGGGFLVVPALVLVLRMPMAAAAGTSLVVIAINATASFASRAHMASFDWAIILPFAAAAIVGTLAGKRIADRLSGVTLTRGFGVLIGLVGVFVAVESLVGR